MKAGKAGGTEAIIKVINTHIDNANVCKCGCAVLCFMIDAKGKNIDKMNNEVK